MRCNETKRAILEIGLELFRQNGYHHTGLKEILDQANIPKGSFYHYFKSKEDFGLQAIDLYAESSEGFTIEVEATHQGGLERVKAFFTQACQKMEDGGFSGGCLLGNLSQELADSNPAFKERLDAHWKSSCHTLSKWVRQAQKEGEIPSSMPAEDIANFLLNSYQGAILRSKVSQCCTPFAQFHEVVFKKVLI